MARNKRDKTDDKEAKGPPDEETEAQPVAKENKSFLTDLFDILIEYGVPAALKMIMDVMPGGARGALKFLGNPAINLAIRRATKLSPRLEQLLTRLQSDLHRIAGEAPHEAVEEQPVVAPGLTWNFARIDPSITTADLLELKEFRDTLDPDDLDDAERLVYFDQMVIQSATKPAEKEKTDGRRNDRGNKGRRSR